MPRYFIEVAYKGTKYSGFQIQRNALTIQEEVEKAFLTYYRVPVELTGSSRTDTGVHARQNYFHFDKQKEIAEPENDLYHFNALLPADIVAKNLFRVKEDAHCRFDAFSREYGYYIYNSKDPFLKETAFFFPYRVDVEKMNAAGRLLSTYHDFTSFSKRRTQVKNFICDIKKCEWGYKENELVFRVEANRFLRGMVKGLVGTMLLVGRDKLSITDFQDIIEKKDCTLADFSVPSHGLFLERVNYDLTAITVL